MTALIAAEQTAAVVTVLFPTIASGLRLASGELGLLAAGARLASTPFGPLWVWTAQRTSHRLALALSCALWGLATVAGGFSAVWLSGLHRTYPRDRACLESELARRGNTHAPERPRIRAVE